MEAWDSTCGGGATGAKAISSSTGIFLGLPHPFSGGITSTKEDSYLISESYDKVH